MQIENNEDDIMGVNKSPSTEHWFKSHWRPMAAYVYLLICFMDFIGFPLMTMFLPKIIGVGTYMPWKALTLDGGGLIHMAFGAILGISAWTRGSEKITEMNLNRPYYGGGGGATTYERSNQTVRATGSDKPVYVPKGRPDPNEDPDSK